jgi:hypothetical protein
MKKPTTPRQPPPGTKHPEGGWHNGVSWLTWEEREELTRVAKENDEYAKKAFAHLRPKKAKEGGE